MLANQPQLIAVENFAIEHFLWVKNVLPRENPTRFDSLFTINRHKSAMNWSPALIKL